MPIKIPLPELQIEFSVAAKTRAYRITVSSAGAFTRIAMIQGHNPRDIASLVWPALLNSLTRPDQGDELFGLRDLLQ
jgi:hypothetical protein